MKGTLLFLGLLTLDMSFIEGRKLKAYVKNFKTVQKYVYRIVFAESKGSHR